MSNTNPLKSSQVPCTDHYQYLLKNDPDNTLIDIYSFFEGNQKRIEVTVKGRYAFIGEDRVGIVKDAGAKGNVYLHGDNGKLYYGKAVNKNVYRFVLNRRYWK